MKVVVITGSSRGIGFGLVQAFLKSGCKVVVSGSSSESTEQAADKLGVKSLPERLIGIPCNVTSFGQVSALWEQSKSKFGQVDIWVNNAGLAGDYKEIWKQAPEKVEMVVSTNLLGVIYGSQVAIKGMLAQGFGKIFNMEGAGSDGRMHPGTNLYGATKYGLKYLNDALAQELKETPITLCALRPGMVITDLILKSFEGRPDDWEQAKRIFNIIADRVETVSPWLAEQMLKTHKNGTRIHYSSSLKIFLRFLSSPFIKRDLFSKIDIDIR